MKNNFIYVSQWFTNKSESEDPRNDRPASKLFNYKWSLCTAINKLIGLASNITYYTDTFTSGIFGLIAKVKQPMTLAVPGIIVCMAKSRCIAVEVKKPSIIIKLNEFSLREQYFANAVKVLRTNISICVIIYWEQGDSNEM